MMRASSGLFAVGAHRPSVHRVKSPFLAPIAVLVALAGAGGIACSNKSEAAPKTRPAPLVVVAKVAARDVAAEVRAPVELRPLAQAEVGSKTLGYLDAVLVERGDKVKRGQLVALVRPSDLPDQLVAARGSLSQAQASGTLARNNLERVTNLAPSGVVSQQELQQAQAAVATAEAQEAAAKAQVAAYATRLGETQITSPLDGVVAVRRLDPGALVGPTASQTILTVAQTNVLRVFVTVTEREVHLVKVGQKAHVEVDALAGRSVEGAVVRLAPILDPATRTLDAEVQIDNASGDLRPGMFGRGSITVDVHPQAAVIPATALSITNGKRYVFVLAGEKVQRREIETGVDEGTWLEVKKGLAAGEEVVTVGMDAISDGATVRVSRDVDPFKGHVDAGAAPPRTDGAGAR
jgi:membrane fusion protein, multidrug efflux system